MFQENHAVQAVPHRPHRFPQPVMTFLGNAVTGPVSVFAGQQITIEAKVPAPPMGTVVSYGEWFLDTGMLSGGFTANSTVGQEADDPTPTWPNGDFSDSKMTFYWVNPGDNEVVTYIYTLSSPWCKYLNSGDPGNEAGKC